MYGCKYCKMDMMKQEEYCELTDELTKGDPKCDFMFELCPEYQKAQKHKSAPQLTQTSIFGAAGEKPFKVG